MTKLNEESVKSNLIRLIELGDQMSINALMATVRRADDPALLAWMEAALNDESILARKLAREAERAKQIELARERELKRAEDASKYSKSIPPSLTDEEIYGELRVALAEKEFSQARALLERLRSEKLRSSALALYEHEIERTRASIPEDCLGDRDDALILDGGFWLVRAPASPEKEGAIARRREIPDIFPELDVQQVEMAYTSLVWIFDVDPRLHEALCESEMLQYILLYNLLKDESPDIHDIGLLPYVRECLEKSIKLSEMKGREYLSQEPSGEFHITLYPNSSNIAVSHDFNVIENEHLEDFIEDIFDEKEQAVPEDVFQALDQWMNSDEPIETFTERYSRVRFS